MLVVNVMQSVVAKRIKNGAEGGSRTRTSLRTTDFKSVASAIPPPRHLSTKSHVLNLILLPARYVLNSNIARCFSRLRQWPNGRMR